MAVFTFDPKQFVTIVTPLGNPVTGQQAAAPAQSLSGFADDDFIEIERDEDAFSKKVGVDGQTTRAKTNNQSAHFTVRLMQSSASNDFLTIVANADENNNLGVCQISFKDLSGRSVFAAGAAWVKKRPKTSWKKGVAFWEWAFDCDQMQFDVGGN